MSGEGGFVEAEVEGEVVQVVDGRGELRADALGAYISKSCGEEEYIKVVAVLGAKGSGRSTLMNRLFGTQFEVGRPFSGKGTKGCWVGFSGTEGSRVLVMDTQGSDGREGEGEKVAKVATLTLSLADVLIFNLWAADLGRYEAAGYSLLRSVFVEYLKMYQRSEDRTKTMILFVIRDHDDESPIEALKNLLMHDIKNLWLQLDKSEGPVELAEFFDFEFVSLPHIRHRKVEFDYAIESLREKLTDPDLPETFLRSKYCKTPHLPAISIATFADVVWKDIDQDKDVELPGRKDLIAAYRCDVAFDSQLRPGLNQLNRWTSDVDRGRMISNFGTKASQLFETALAKYDRDTSSHAAAPVRAKKRAELQSSLQARVRLLFNKQLLLLQNAALQKFKDILLNTVANGDMISEHQTQEALRRVDEWFSRKAEELLVRSMRLSFRTARLEVQNALQTFGENFKSSPTAQLQAMRQMERQAMRPPPRKRNIEFGLNVNVACRPAGFGNFQLVTGYARGPHSFQATIVNDKDAAEQEGQGQVPFLRIQPTINTNIDL